MDTGGPGISLRDPATTKAAAAEPFELAGESFVPQLHPQLAPGKPARVCLLLYGASAEPSALVRVEARVRDRNGKATTPARFAVVGRTKPDARGLTKLLVELEGEPLPPGEYSLSVTYRDPAGKGTPAETEAAFRIL
jgi:hypothetical protein